MLSERGRDHAARADIRPEKSKTTGVVGVKHVAESLIALL